MKRFFIPRLGDSFTLAEPWTFLLIKEWRNSKLVDWVEPDFKKQMWSERAAVQSVTLPVGTVLKVSRIYIRQNCTAFDSVTFNGTIPPRVGEKKPRKARFFAKLDDVNRMMVED